jgi:proline iminopeptidase
MYPVIQPYLSSRLAVSPIHNLSITQYGNPKGVPVVFLHGGPGGGTSGTDARRFDPSKYHITLFDQRGSGESTPAS